MKTVVTMRDLLEAGAHFGHNSRYWNPKMSPYIYGAREKIHIINLEHTIAGLRKSQEFVRDLARNRNKLLFVSTKRAASKIVEEAAKSIGQPYVNHRWLGGMLTNYKTIRMSIRRYNSLKIQFEDGTINKLTKKEVLMHQRELQKLEFSIGGIKNMGGLPDAVFVIDIDKEYIAINEITSLGIPIIAVVDTNCNPDKIDHIIPGNDDSHKAIKLFVNAITQAYAEGAEDAEKINPVGQSGPTVTTTKKKPLSLRKKTPEETKVADEEVEEVKAEEVKAMEEPTPVAADANESSNTPVAETEPEAKDEAEPNKEQDKPAQTELPL